MASDLKGKKVVISGISAGIGRALALAFAQAGARVAGCARDEWRLQKTRKAMAGRGHVIACVDITQQVPLEAFYEKTIKAFAGVDILINNVGAIGNSVDFFQLEDKDWQAAFEANFMTAVRLCRLFIPHLRDSKAPRIINISSIAAEHPGQLFPHYSAQKAALSNLSMSLAQTLANDGILVNTISPGPVWTQSWEAQAQHLASRSDDDGDTIKQAMRSSVASTAVLKRMGAPEDITGLALFLASDQAAWITGSNFIVDGGVLVKREG